MAAAGKIATKLAPYAAVALAVGCNQIIGLDAGKPAAQGTGGAGGSGAHSASTTSSTSSATSTGGATSTSSTTSMGGATSSASASSSMGGAGGTGGGGSSCDAGLAECGGSCVDTQTDQHHCGRCQHDCLYGECAAGMCQAWTVVPNANVALNPANGGFYKANQIAADGKYVAWIDSSGNVHQVPAAGGATSTAITATKQSAAGVGLRFGGGVLAFVDATSNLVDTVVEGNSSAKVEATFNGCTGAGMALDPNGTVAYVSGSCIGGNEFLSCPLNGMPCGPFSLDTGDAALFQVSGSTAFWATSSINSNAFMGSAPTNTVSVGVPVQALAIDGSNVYWVTGESSPGSNPPFQVYALPQSFTSSTVPRAVTSTSAGSPLPIMGVASDGTNVYFGTLNLCGIAGLYYAPINGSSPNNPTTMFTSAMGTFLTAEGYVVAAGGAVYWVDVGSFGNPAPVNIMGIVAP